MNLVKTAHKLIFALFAVLLLLIGGVGFLLPYGVMPRIAKEMGEENLHITQEAGAGAIALGMLAGWCAFNYERSRPLHLILLLFFVLISILHWVDFFRSHGSIASGIINSLPTVILVVLYVALPSPRPENQQT